LALVLLSVPTSLLLFALSFHLVFLSIFVFHFVFGFFASDGVPDNPKGYGLMVMVMYEYGMIHGIGSIIGVLRISMDGCVSSLSMG
jgi:hypothetical protein